MSKIIGLRTWPTNTTALGEQDTLFVREGSREARLLSNRPLVSGLLAALISGALLLIVSVWMIWSVPAEWLQAVGAVIHDLGFLLIFAVGLAAYWANWIVRRRTWKRCFGDGSVFLSAQRSPEPVRTLLAQLCWAHGLDLWDEVLFQRGLETLLVLQSLVVASADRSRADGLVAEAEAIIQELLAELPEVRA